jgi:galacturonosyltransferase
MKILILINDDILLYRLKYDLVKQLQSLGHEIILSLPNGSHVSKFLKIGCRFIETHIDRRGLNLITDLGLYRKYKNIIKTEKPDYVITYTIKPNIYGGFVSRIKKVPYAVNITGLGTAFQKDNWLKRFVVFLYKVALKKVAVVFFENVENKEVFVKERIIPEEKSCILNGAGVNLTDFPFSPLIEKENTSFLFISRIMHEKGVEELFEAIKRIKKEYPTTEFNFIGGFEENYADTVKEMQSNGYLKYYGKVDNVQDYIVAADCTILPSYHEGMSNALLESAAMGRALITSDIHGCKEAVIENGNGFLCKAKDIESLYIAIKKFIELPFEEKRKMGEMSRKHMEETFDKSKVVEKTILNLRKK